MWVCKLETNAANRGRYLDDPHYYIVVNTTEKTPSLWQFSVRVLEIVFCNGKNNSFYLLTLHKIWVVQLHFIRPEVLETNTNEHFNCCYVGADIIIWNS